MRKRNSAHGVRQTEGGDAARLRRGHRRGLAEENVRVVGPVVEELLCDRNGDVELVVRHRGGEGDVLSLVQQSVLGHAAVRILVRSVHVNRLHSIHTTGTTQRSPSFRRGSYFIPFTPFFKGIMPLNRPIAAEIGLSMESGACCSCVWNVLL